MRTTTMGFGTDVQDRVEAKKELFRHVEPEDLIRFGLIPELIGRVPVIAPLEPLTDEAMREILVEPRNAIVKQYKKLFGMEGVELEFRDDAVAAIIEKAKQRKTGARALRGVVEEAMLDVMYTLPDRENLQTVIVTEETIMRSGEPIYIYSEEKIQQKAAG